MMFADWDDYYGEDEVHDLVKRYNDMRCRSKIIFFDLHEFENLIDFYLNEYNYKEALEAVKLAIDQHPYALSVRMKHIQILIESGKPSKALRIIREMEKTEQTNDQICLFKGFALNITGKRPESIACFDKAIRLCSEGKDELAYSIAQSFLQINQLFTANKYLILAYKFNRNNMLALYDLAINYERLNFCEKSIEYYRKYLDLDPWAEYVWNNLGMLYLRTHNLTEALEAFDFATAINPEYLSAYLNKAEVMIICKEHSQAVEIYKQVLQKDPVNTKALCCLGDCYEETGKYPEALDTYNKAISCCAENSDAWFGKGMVFMRQKKYSLGITSLKTAIQIEPANSNYWFMLGELYSRLRKFAKAVNAYRKTVQINPLDHEAWLACAQVFFRKRKIVDAIDMLSESYQHINTNPTLHYRLAAYHVYRQDFNNAMKHFEQGLKLNYPEYQEMFRLFPKTKKYDFFYSLIEKHLQVTEQNMNN